MFSGLLGGKEQDGMAGRSWRIPGYSVFFHFLVVGPPAEARALEGPCYLPFCYVQDLHLPCR